MVTSSHTPSALPSQVLTLLPTQEATLPEGGGKNWNQKGWVAGASLGAWQAWSI